MFFSSRTSTSLLLLLLLSLLVVLRSPLFRALLIFLAMPLLATLEPIRMVMSRATLLAAEVLARVEATAAALVQPGAKGEIVAAVPGGYDLAHVGLPLVEGIGLQGVHVVAVHEMVQQGEDVAVHVDFDNLQAGLVAVAHGLGVFAFEVDVVLEKVFEAVQDHGVLGAGLLFFVLLLFALVETFVRAVGVAAADVVDRGNRRGCLAVELGGGCEVVLVLVMLFDAPYGLMNRIIWVI
jgi:hypothetical protein